MIIDNHSGKPKIKVKIRCLEVLKKYGISPHKLIIIILINSVATDCLSPFRLFMYVRVSWAVIIIKNGVIIEFARDGDNQNVRLIIIIRDIFIIINNQSF